jgi:hypothetical protein
MDGKEPFFWVARSWKATGTLSFVPPREVTVTLNVGARCDAISESYEVSVLEIHRELPEFPESALVSDVSWPQRRLRPASAPNSMPLACDTQDDQCPDLADELDGSRLRPGVDHAGGALQELISPVLGDGGNRRLGECLACAGRRVRYVGRYWQPAWHLGGEMGLAASSSSYPLLNLFWTMLEFFLWVIWIWILIMVFIDIFRSHDLSGGAKALWFLFVLFIPLIGVLVYLIARGGSMGERAAGRAQR